LVTPSLFISQFQAEACRCSYRVALSYRLVEFTLSRLLMLEPIWVTATLKQQKYIQSWVNVAAC